MSKRTSSNATNGSTKDSVGEPGTHEFYIVGEVRANCVFIAAVDKQKKLLADDTGHFSMIKMLHLADLITELNGIALSFSSFLPIYGWRL